MTIYDTKIVDAIWNVDSLNEVHLLLTDHLDWNENVDEHLAMLQDKLNVYISFIESGEILVSYPNSVGSKLIIDIRFKYLLSLPLCSGPPL
ncbi:MAG: DUF6572 domain-containing protein [Sulfitobacter sp.]